MTDTTDTTTPTDPIPNTYQIYMVGAVEPLIFIDDDPYPVILEQWLTKRQTLDRLEGDYEAAKEAYVAACERAETLGDGGEPPDRPAKLTLTEDLLLTFRGNKNGQLGGAVYVGNVMGLRVI